jgi:hypothetical protein
LMSLSKVTFSLCTLANATTLVNAPTINTAITLFTIDFITALLTCIQLTLDGPLGPSLRKPGVFKQLLSLRVNTTRSFLMTRINSIIFSLHNYKRSVHITEDWLIEACFKHAPFVRTRCRKGSLFTLSLQNFAFPYSFSTAVLIDSIPRHEIKNN